MSNIKLVGALLSVAAAIAHPVGAYAHAAAATSSASIDNQTLSGITFENIAVETSSHDSNYTVVDARFNETATAGALFGIVGAGISSGVAAGQDDQKADRLRETARAIDLAGILTNSASAVLAQQSNPAVADSKDAASHLLRIEIRNWGLIRAERDDPRLRTFLNLTWRILDRNGETVFEQKRQNAVTSTLRPLDQFTDEIFTSEMESLAAKAGQQIAYQIIYR